MTFPPPINHLRLFWARVGSFNLSNPSSNSSNSPLKRKLKLNFWDESRNIPFSIFSYFFVEARYFRNIPYSETSNSCVEVKINELFHHNLYSLISEIVWKRTEGGIFLDINFILESIQMISKLTVPEYSCQIQCNAQIPIS